MIEPATPLEYVPGPDDPPDLAIGAFTPHAPWIVDPDAMPWRFAHGDAPDITTLRSQAADLARTLVHPKHLPSAVVS